MENLSSFPSLILWLNHLPSDFELFKPKKTSKTPTMMGTDYVPLLSVYILLVTLTGDQCLMIACSENSHSYCSMQLLRSSLKSQVIRISIQWHKSMSNKPWLAVISLKWGDSQRLGLAFCISFFILLHLLKFSLQSGFWNWESCILTTCAINAVTFSWKICTCIVLYFFIWRKPFPQHHGNYLRDEDY